MSNLLDKEECISIRCKLIEKASKNISSIPKTKFIFSKDQLLYRQEFVKKTSWRAISLETKKILLLNLAIDLDKMLNLGLVHGDINYSNIIYNGTSLKLIDLEPSIKQFKNNRVILASGLSFRSKNDYKNNFITSETDKIGFYFFCEYHLNQGNSLGYNKKKFDDRLNGSLIMKVSEQKLTSMQFSDILKLFS